MTKTITVVCDTHDGIIYGSIEEARKAYYDYISEQDEAGFNDWLDCDCIIDTIEVEV